MVRKSMKSSSKKISKKISGNKRKNNSRSIVQRDASPVKIAYYVQRMLEKKMGTKDIIYIISSQFGNDSVREFAKMYRYCFYIEDIRRIANLIYNISKKDMNKAMDSVLHDILIKKDILPSDYIRERSSDKQKKINIKVL